MKPRRRQIALITGSIGAVLMLYACWWLFLRPPTADEVARMAADALTKGDVNTLLRLTLPEERDKLHLTPESVRGMLTDTIYTHGIPGKMTVKRIQDYPVDQWQYNFSPTDGNMRGLRYPLPVMITQRPDGRWYLPLGYLLLATSAMEGPAQDALDVRQHFRQLARRHGVLGVRLNTSGYSMTPASPSEQTAGE